MEELVRDAISTDQYFFYFSGHGSQRLDESGEEADGWDESESVLIVYTVSMV